MSKFILIKTLFMAVILLALIACDSNDGPLEKAGKTIDDKATDMGNMVEDACEDVKKDLNAKDTDC